MIVQLYSLDAEFSKPMWIFGVSSYGFLGKDDTSNKIVCCYRFFHVFPYSSVGLLCVIHNFESYPGRMEGHVLEC